MLNSAQHYWVSICLYNLCFVFFVLYVDAHNGPCSTGTDMVRTTHYRGGKQVVFFLIEIYYVTFGLLAVNKTNKNKTKMYTSCV